MPNIYLLQMPWKVRSTSSKECLPRKATRKVSGSYSMRVQHDSQTEASREARVSPRSMAGSPNASTARTEVKVLLDQLS